MTLSASPTPGWEELLDEDTLRRYFVSDEGVDLDYPERIAVKHGAIFIDGDPLPKPFKLTERIRYQEVAFKTAQWLWESAMAACERFGGKDCLDHVMAARREMEICHSFIESYVSARDEFVNGTLEQADITAHAELAS